MAKSYKDPHWSNLSANTEKLLKLPSGLLQNIVMHGEKSNADQVSSVGARTVFQITPTTRNLVLKKYGVDAYLNDKNAAMAAGLLLQESLKRNNGNVEAAIGEYHGGTDRTNWGPINKAYRQRVMGAQGGTQPQQQQSTYQRVKQSMVEQQAPTIAKVYEAYKSGKLNKQQRKDFEADVRAGAIMLPEGAQLNNAAKAKPPMLPQAVSDAYAAGELNPQQRADLESDIKAGLVRLPIATKNKSNLPDFDAAGTVIDQPTEQSLIQQQPESSLADTLKGAGEVALTVGTGAVAAPVASVVGTLGQAGREIVGGQFGSPEAAQRIAQSAGQAAQDYTYQPRTQEGQQQLQAVGDALSPLESLPPVLGGAGVQAATLGRAAAPQGVIAAQRAGQAVVPVVEKVGQTVQRPIQATTNAVKTGVDSLKDAVGLSRAQETPAPANMGAAQVDKSVVRQALAQDLPYAPELTQGQITRDPAQLKFEVETAKDGELGAPIRQRYEEQHQVMQQNIDAFIDMTGSKSNSMRDAGIAVDKALQKQMQVDKTRVRVAYAKADKSEEAQTPVDLTQPVRMGESEPMTVVDYLNSQPDLPTTPILTSAKRTAESLGIVRRGENGELVANNPTIKQMEKWRQEINANTNQEAPNIRQSAILKDMIDQHVEPVAGSLYKSARLERKRMAEHWENRTIIKDLTQNKAGTEDRKVALEDVQKRIIHDGSLDDLRFARRALLTAGDEGKQAWKDIQGQTLQEIKTEATKNVAPDAQGNQMISPAALNKAINKLDSDGKLDFIFGRDGAEKLRALNDISKTLFTVPASAAVNHSNTAATLMAAMDIALSGLSGFPAPVASALRLSTKHIKDKKTRARVQQALGPRSTSE